MYMEGRGGLPQDDRQAVELFRRSADQGYAGGQVSLGYMYKYGRGGLPQDDRQAVEWYRKSAEQGFASGQRNLGFMYENGYSVARDDDEAARWYRKAAEQGDAYAQFHLGLMYRVGRGVAADESEAMSWLRKSAAQGDAAAKTYLGLVYLLPSEQRVGNVAVLVLVAALVVGFGISWSWQKPLQAWLLASVLAPGYLLLAVLFQLDHFGGWFDVEFVVICLWGILVGGVGSLAAKIALRRRHPNA
jgi:TPR repeat protein